MRIKNLIHTLCLLILTHCLLMGWQKSTSATELFSSAIQAPRPPETRPKNTVESEKGFPSIFFEKTVCDLGDVGQGTKNTCEFKFTNTGRGPLKITHVRRTCGCTVFELDKKEYAPGEAGVVKVSYTAGRATARMQKNIYISTNDKDNPRVKLTINPRTAHPIAVT